jgi:hypothetical protein
MNRVQVISIGSVVLLALGLAGGKSVAVAVPELKLLTGVVWQRMFAEAKVTYILAVAQLILCDINIIIASWVRGITRPVTIYKFAGVTPRDSFLDLGLISWWDSHGSAFTFIFG